MVGGRLIAAVINPEYWTRQISVGLHQSAPQMSRKIQRRKRRSDMARRSIWPKNNPKMIKCLLVHIPRTDLWHLCCVGAQKHVLIAAGTVCPWSTREMASTDSINWRAITYLPAIFNPIDPQTKTIAWGINHTNSVLRDNPLKSTQRISVSCQNNCYPPPAGSGRQA